MNNQTDKAVTEVDSMREQAENAFVDGLDDNSGSATKSATASRNVAGEWATEAQLAIRKPRFSDLRQTAICADGSTWNYCGTNAWFRTSRGN